MSFKKVVLALLLGSLLTGFHANAQNWQTNFEKAKELAKKENNRIVLVFQGSDWCAPCIKLDRDIWSSPEFQALAESQFVMLKADFPRKQKNKLPNAQEEHNKALAAKYNPNGYFPFVVVLDASGKKLGEAGYEKIPPKAYFNKLNALK